jgi:hypothetical protein
MLKAELDRLLAGKFIDSITNIQWVSPMVIVPKKGGSGEYASIIRL